MKEVILTLSYLISLLTMLKAICSVWYFVLLLKPQMVLCHCSEKPFNCSEKPFREFWTTVMIWFSPRVTLKHKGPIVLQYYWSVVKDSLLLVVLEWFLTFQACQPRGEPILNSMTSRCSSSGPSPHSVHEPLGKAASVHASFPHSQVSHFQGCPPASEVGTCIH